MLQTPVIHGSLEWVCADAAVLPPSADAHVAVYLRPGAAASCERDAPDARAPSPPPSPSVTLARAPLLLDSPHSGRLYPADFEFAPDFVRVRRGEDAYVDRLILPALAHGASVIAALFPRTYIDCNRHEKEVDLQLVQGGAWPHPIRPSEKSARGLGLLRRYITPGVSVYAPGHKLSAREIGHRIRTYYEPYHALLSNTLDEIHQELGGVAVYHINFHSMKSRGNAMTPDGAGAKRPDFVVGDLRGAACERAFTDEVAAALREQGWTVSVNKPYAGAGILKRYGEPDAGVHCLQVEMNRALYLDEERVELLTRSGQYDDVERRLERVFARLTHWCRARVAQLRSSASDAQSAWPAHTVAQPVPLLRKLKSAGVRVSSSLSAGVCLPEYMGERDGDAGGADVGGEASDPDSNEEDSDSDDDDDDKDEDEKKGERKDDGEKRREPSAFADEQWQS